MRTLELLVQLTVALKNQSAVNTKMIDYAIEVTGMLPANEKREPVVDSLRALFESVSTQRESVEELLSAVKKAVQDE